MLCILLYDLNDVLCILLYDLNDVLCILLYDLNDVLCILLYDLILYYYNQCCLEFCVEVVLIQNSVTFN